MDFDTSPIFQVSEFNEVVNNHLSLLGEVTIEGELTRLDIKNGRLIFGSIKDESSSLDIFTMSHLVRNFREFEPGMKVRVTGTAGLYKGSSKFRLMVTSMVPQGEGALQIAFEKLKARLEAEGLFADERKRPLPLWPTKIGLITAKNSSAYFDLVKILTARMGDLKIKLLPVNVQGREAIPTILNAFNFVNSHHLDFDVIIMARGGGSLEDLAAFNSEEIARAIFSSRVLIVSAIGHEDNWSLCDYIADLRASTPSNAAELVVRDPYEVRSEINSWIQLMKIKINQEITFRRSTLNHFFQLAKSHLNISEQRQKIDQIIANMKLKLTYQISLTQNNLNHLNQLIATLDIQNTLDRGFSITKNNEGKVIKNIIQVQKGELLETVLAKGIIKSITT